MGWALQAAAASGSSLSCLLPCPFVQMWSSPARGSLPEWPWPLHQAFLITMDPNQRIYLPSSCFCLVLLSQWWENLPRTKHEGCFDISGYFILFSERGHHWDDPVYELGGDLPAGRAGNTQLTVPRLHVHWHCLMEPRTPWWRRGLQAFQNGLPACFCWAPIQQGLIVNGYKCVIYSNRAFTERATFVTRTLGLFSSRKKSHPTLSPSSTVSHPFSNIHSGVAEDNIQFIRRKAAGASTCTKQIDFLSSASF